MSNATEPNRTKRRHSIVALSLAGLVAGMVGLAFASVPLTGAEVWLVALKKASAVSPIFTSMVCCTGAKVQGSP